MSDDATADERGFWGHIAEGRKGFLRPRPTVAHYFSVYARRTACFWGPTDPEDWTRGFPPDGRACATCSKQVGRPAT